MKAVNLLPADRRKGAARSRPKLTPLHGVGAFLLVGALALGYWGHGITGQAAEQATQADELEATAQGLQAQLTKLQAEQSGGPQGSSFQTDRTLVVGLARARVNWSNVMINLSRVAPKGVWLKSIKIETPSADAAAAAGGATTKRPAAITVEGGAKTRTIAVMFLSRLDAVPGFDGPRLAGGLNKGDGSGYGFTIEIPVDDGVFGPDKPTAPSSTASGAGATPTSSTPTTETP